MLPTFPEFKSLDITDRAVVDAYTHRYPPYNDFGFTSLWSWDTNDTRKICDLRGNLVVQFTDYHTQAPFLSFLGDVEPEQTARELIRFAESAGMDATLRLVPDVSVAGIRPSVLDVREDRDSFDYLLSVPDIARYAGAAYKKKRSLATRFLRENPNAVVAFGSLADERILSEMRRVIRVWESVKTEQNKEFELQHEEEALERLFRTGDRHDLIVGALFIDQKMHAFTIDELVPDGYALGQFWKADLRVNGIYEYLAQKTAAHLDSLNVSLWNFEQDLGDRNMRASKLSYKPTGYLKKYTIALHSA